VLIKVLLVQLNLKVGNKLIQKLKNHVGGKKFNTSEEVIEYLNQPKKKT
jgi:replication initiation and membrane attachment protein DnaB